MIATNAPRRASRAGRSDTSIIFTSSATSPSTPAVEPTATPARKAAGQGRTHTRRHAKRDPATYHPSTTAAEVLKLIRQSAPPETYMPFLEGLPHRHLALVAAYLAFEATWGGTIHQAEHHRPQLALVVDQ